MPRALLLKSLYYISVLGRALLANAIGHNVVLSGAPILGTTFHPLPAEDPFLIYHLTHLFLYTVAPFIVELHGCMCFDDRPCLLVSF